MTSNGWEEKSDPKKEVRWLIMTLFNKIKFNCISMSWQIFLDRYQIIIPRMDDDQPHHVRHPLHNHCPQQFIASARIYLSINIGLIFAYYDRSYTGNTAQPQ